jgi:Archaeal transcriptional regulator TrmB
MKWLVILALLVSFAQAQQTNQSEPAAPTPPANGGQAAPPPAQIYPENAQQLLQFSEVAQAIGSATSELMLATDVLRSQEIAEAVRAAVTRGVAVYILTPTENVEDPESYLVSLALAGASVRLSPVDGSFVTIDRQSVVVGVLVSGVKGLPGYEEMDRTILVPDATYTAPYVEGFYESFELAPALDPQTLSMFQPQGGEQ